MKSRGKRRTGGHILNTLLIGLLLIDPVSAETHQEVQYWRRYYGLPAQEFDLGLTLVARQHAEWMARNDAFQHGQHDQVIAIGYSSPRQTVAAWIPSPPHRAWLLSGERRAGWAVATSRRTGKR